VQKNYVEKYKWLLRQFFNSLNNDIPFGIPAPHIPSVGELYEKAKYKIAFFGMETNGWADMVALKNAFDEAPERAIEYLTEEFKKVEFLNWTNNFGTSFFNYVLQFVAKFYNIDNWKLLRTEAQYMYLLKTFIWGNTNSIERYEISAQPNGVDFSAWLKVKNASKIFDTAAHILDTCPPDILLVLNWSESEDWLGKGRIYEKDELDDHLFHIYLKETDTHVYWLAHPRWLAINIGFENSINKIIEDINKRNIHIENGAIDELLLKEEFDRIDDKKKYIGLLARFLSRRKMKMSGLELALHLNRNGFRTSYNTEYAGTRGTYKLINDCYSYFANNGRQDIADDLATAFVRDNGEFAYE